MTPQNCRFTVRGATFTANGAPDVREVGEVTIVGLSERLEMDFDITGAVDWETGSPARRGRCSLDLDLTGVIDQRPDSQPIDTVAVLQDALSGTACDEAINLSARIHRRKLTPAPPPVAPARRSPARGTRRAECGSFPEARFRRLDSYSWPDELPPFYGSHIPIDPRGRAWV